MPPLPISATISYAPRRVPALSAMTASTGYAANGMISSSTDVSTPESSFSTLANTESSIKYSLQLRHCATGSCLRITIVLSETLKGRSVVVGDSVPPHVRHFMGLFSESLDLAPIHPHLDDRPSRDMPSREPHIDVMRPVDAALAKVFLDECEGIIRNLSWLGHSILQSCHFAILRFHELIRWPRAWGCTAARTDAPRSGRSCRPESHGS